MTEQDDVSSIGEEWMQFAATGDEWFLAYLHIQDDACSEAPSPWLFCGGHALELYLKAAWARVHGPRSALRYGHRLFDLWEDVSKLSDFPFRVRLRRSIFERTTAFSPSHGADLAYDDQMHLLRHHALYRVLNHVQDLKYLGTEIYRTKLPKEMSFGHWMPDYYMVYVLFTLKEWLGHSTKSYRLKQRLTKFYAEPMMFVGCSPKSPSAASARNR